MRPEKNKIIDCPRFTNMSAERFIQLSRVATLALLRRFEHLVSIAKETQVYYKDCVKSTREGVELLDKKLSEEVE